MSLPPQRFGICRFARTSLLSKTTDKSCFLENPTQNIRWLARTVVGTVSTGTILDDTTNGRVCASRACAHPYTGQTGILTQMDQQGPLSSFLSFNKHVAKAQYSSSIVYHQERHIRVARQTNTPLQQTIAVFQGRIHDAQRSLATFCPLLLIAGGCIFALPRCDAGKKAGDLCAPTSSAPSNDATVVLVDNVGSSQRFFGRRE